MAAIELTALQKRYGRVEAVRSIDLDIPDGQVTVLVGPSGCGKTTTLRLIAGLETSTGGSISIGGRDVTGLEPKERDLAMVFQNYALYPHMKVRENIAFGLRARKVAKDESARRVSRAAELLGIEPLLDRKPSELSGGQQQRVAIGRAIVREPAAFLFDEPLSNLDAKLRVEMRTEVLRLQREIGATIVHVTHDQEEAMTLAHRVVVMNGGAIEQVGTPAEVYRAPATEFVARFIGSPEMNIVPGDVARAALGGGNAVSGERIGVRPEDVQPAAAVAADAAALRFDARIDVIELTGSQAIITLAGPDDRAMLALVSSRAAATLEEGATASFAVARDALLEFDGDGHRVVR
jgi:sn-glycerol 3-phosphate transport system ATP-binding protein